MEEKNKGITQQTIVVILAAGKGTRMGKTNLAKVCLEIDSVPAINRTITTFKKLGFVRFMVVVGDRAEQVIETISKEHSNIIYIHQNQQLGTGHAAKIASEALQNIGYTSNILVTMADKFIAPQAVQILLNGFIKQQADMALLTIPKSKATQASGGRVILDENGQALDIIETPDLSRQLIADKINEKISKSQKITTSQISKIINSYLSNSKKQVLALPELLKLTNNGKYIKISDLKKILDLPKYNLRVNGKKYTAKEIESRCKGVNPSLYMFNADAFYLGVEMIDNNSAQGEYYLTDVVKHLSGIKDTTGKNKFRVRAVPAGNPNLVQGFNSPDELLAIQDYIRQKKGQKYQPTAASRPHLKASQYCTVQKWLNKISNQKPSLKRWLNQIYGQYDLLHQQKCEDLKKVLKCYGRRFGFDQKVCIIRAPGRINLMGRHVDHRGGFNNFMAINRETIAVAGLRKDNNVIAVNTQPKKFKTLQFNITDLIGRFAWSDWINFVNSHWVRNMLYSSAGNWGNYIKAAALRLQHKFQDIKIKGINLAVTGNVPIAAGLSSSSTIVVATLQAAIALNNFKLTSQQFIDLCGEGEWFVGSRGGAGDHAAIYLGQRGKIAQVGYLPFRVEKVIDAPKDYQVIIADSHIKAPKSSSAKEKFNAKITSYNLGLAFLKMRCPEIKDTLEYIRDINPEKLGCTTSQIYRMLLKIPESMSRKNLREILSKEYEQMLETNFATHSTPLCYNIRSVLLFGAAEIMRSKMCIDLLESGRINEFGNLMKISHNGDRDSAPALNGGYQPTHQNCSDDYLNKLITDLAGEDPQKVLNAQLYMQPGGYACSTPQIDCMVDVACSVQGTAGAQIAGAGLGGCIMILVEKNHACNVQKALIKHYYKPHKLRPAMISCTTVEGAGLVEF